jgi:hypothetical protein
MRIIAASCTLLAFALFAAPAAAGPAQSENRYVSPSGAFSISMADAGANHFRAAGGETENADMVVADFPYVNSMGLALPWRRTVEWLRLEKPVDPSQYDSQATDAVAGYLEARFGGKLTVADRGKFRDADGRLVYAFAAKGIVNDVPTAWQGAVIFFDGGVAPVSELVASPAFASKSGVVNQAIVDWAQTLRPGR